MELTYPETALDDGVVLLRKWQEDDISCIKQAATDPRIPESTTVPALCTPEAAKEFIYRQWRRNKEGEGLSLAIANSISNEAVGLLWLAVRPQHDVLGIGYWIVPNARGRGVGSRAVHLATDWALQTQGAARVEAWVEPDNFASLHLLTSAGFTREGVLRSFLSFDNRRADAVVFSRLPQDD